MNKKVEATTEQKIAMMLLGIQQQTDARIERLNPMLYPGTPKPVAYHQVQFEDGESILVPFFTNKK